MTKAAPTTAKKLPIRKRRFGRFAKSLLAAVSAILALGLCELIVRFSGMAPPARPIWLSKEDSPDVVYRRSENPILGYELKPNYHNQNPDYRKTFARTNSHGRRDIERNVEKPAGVRRVILLGDSVVVGHGLPDIDATISRQMEKLYADGSTEVLNFGISGYCTRSEIELLETKGLKFQPDVVILVFVENDFDNFSPEGFQLKSVFDRPEVVKHLFVGSHLFRLVCVRFNLFHFGADADPLAWNKHAIGDNNVVAGLKRFRELAVEHHFKPLVAIWPHFDNETIQDEHPMPGELDQLVVEKLAAMYGLPTVRLSKWFREDQNAQPDEVNPKVRYSVEGDRIHPNRTGTRIAAEALKKVLAEMQVGRFEMTRQDRSSEQIEGDLKAIDMALKLGQEKEPNYAMVYVEAGKSHADAGDVDEAMRYYQMALKADPESTPALHNMGVVLAKQGKLTEAASRLKQALGTGRAKADTHYNLGKVYLEMGSLKAAVTHFQQAIHLKPDHADTLYNYSDVLTRLGRFRESVAAIDRYLEKQPNDAKAYNNLGITYAQMGRLDQAAAALQRAISIAPNYASAHGNLGRVLLMQKKFTQAITQFQRALELEPGNRQARQSLTAAQAARRNAESR